MNVYFTLAIVFLVLAVIAAALFIRQSVRLGGAKFHFIAFAVLFSCFLACFVVGAKVSHERWVAHCHALGGEVYGQDCYAQTPKEIHVP